MQVLQVGVAFGWSGAGRIETAAFDREQRQMYGACPEVGKEKQWDVQRIGDSVLITSHIAHARKKACLQIYDAHTGKLMEVIKSRNFSEPNMMAVQC